MYCDVMPVPGDVLATSIANNKTLIAQPTGQGFQLYTSGPERQFDDVFFSRGICIPLFVGYRNDLQLRMRAPVGS